MTDVAHFPVETSSSWVVEAFVTSAPTRPVSQYPSRSGIIRKLRAASSAGDPIAETSWISVLIGSSAIPVTA